LLLIGEAVAGTHGPVGVAANEALSV